MTASVTGNQSSLKGETAMAPARTPAPSLIGPLRRLRSLVQDLGALCDEVQRGDATLAERADALRKQADEAAGIVASLPTDGDNADVFQDVKNSWDHLANNPVIKSPLVALAPEVLLRHLKQVEVASETLVCQVGRITIPARINDWLAAMRPGNRISFHQRFEDEIPSLTRRKALLADFASTPRLLPQGLIDPKSGIIYRYSSHKRWQVLSAASLAVSFLAAPCAILFGGHFSLWILTPALARTSLETFVAVSAGSLLHVVIDRIKGAQDAAKDGLPAPGLQMNEALPLINARFGDLVLRLCSLVIAYVAFLYFRWPSAPDFVSALLAGYSADSLVLLAADRLSGSTPALAKT